MSRNRNTKFDGVVVNREVHHDGTICTSDRNGRLCWDSTRAERVVLTNDLRKYGQGLHIGQLGWTTAGTTDGYKWIDVKFDTGQRLSVLVYGLTCVDPTRAEEIANSLIEKNRNTRFDARPDVAESRRIEWIRKSYEPFVATDEMIERGNGSQELYAFAFPSMRQLAALKGEQSFPIKIGYSANEDDGALGRIRSLVVEAAGYPERPSVLLVFRTWDARNLESQIHKILRQQNRKVTSALGKEWYLTNPAELLSIIEKCKQPKRDETKPVKGTSETIEEGFAEILARGDKVTFQMDEGTAAVRIGFESPNRRKRS